MKHFKYRLSWKSAVRPMLNKQKHPELIRWKQRFTSYFTQNKS